MKEKEGKSKERITENNKWKVERKKEFRRAECKGKQSKVERESWTTGEKGRGMKMMRGNESGKERTRKWNSTKEETWESEGDGEKKESGARTRREDRTRGYWYRDRIRDESLSLSDEDVLTSHATYPGFIAWDEFPASLSSPQHPVVVYQERARGDTRAADSHTRGHTKKTHTHTRGNR